MIDLSDFGEYPSSPHFIKDQLGFSRGHLIKIYSVKCNKNGSDYYQAHFKFLMEGNKPIEKSITTSCFLNPDYARVRINYNRRARSSDVTNNFTKMLLNLKVIELSDLLTNEDYIFNKVYSFSKKLSTSTPAYVKAKMNDSGFYNLLIDTIEIIEPFEMQAQK